MNRGSSVATKAAHSANGSLDVRLLLNALIAFKQGDFSVRLPVDWTGVEGKIADNFNDAVATSEQMARELERVGRVVGKEGKINQRASVKDAEGARAGQVEALNALIGDLVWPTSEMARVIGAAHGAFYLMEADAARPAAAGGGRPAPAAHGAAAPAGQCLEVHRQAPGRADRIRRGGKRGGREGLLRARRWRGL